MQVLGLGSGGELERTLNRYSDQKERLKAQLAKFIDHKQRYPANGSAPDRPGFGSSDSRFKSFGNLIRGADKLSHAHLTHNLSVVYSIEGNTLYIYGIYSHDDMGTGSPPNINKQKQQAERWSNMVLAPGYEALADMEKDERPERSQPAKKTTNKPVSVPAPAARPTPPARVDPNLAVAQKMDQLYPARRFLERFTRVATKNEKLALINDELSQLVRVARNNRLYPNQLEYGKGLHTLYTNLTQR